jgi:hypothetical protein
VGKYGLKIKKIRHIFSDGESFSPLGCFKISINNTGIAEAYMSYLRVY